MAETTSLAARRAAEAAPEGVDLVEYRLDALGEPPDFGRLLDGLRLPVMLTCRSAREGGRQDLSAKDRRARWELALGAGAAYVDAEVDDLPKIPSAGIEASIAIIASRHGPLDEDGDQAVRRLLERGKVAKLAVPCQSLDDALQMIALQRRWAERPVAILGLGRWGRLTRWAGRAAGAALGFGHAGRPTGPGQPRASRLLRWGFGGMSRALLRPPWPIHGAPCRMAGDWGVREGACWLPLPAHAWSLPSSLFEEAGIQRAAPGFITAARPRP